jgi:predicted  nucleic acid-binding Zn-ribbon protein
MTESPLSLDCSPREDWSRCVADYEENSDKCQSKCDKFFSCDRKYKGLQLELYELLTLGDTTWEQIQTCTKGSAAQKSSIESLQGSIEKMYENLSIQEKSIEEVENSMRRAVKQLEKTSEGVHGLMEQVAVVRTNLQDRVEGMAKIVPSITKKRSPKDKGRAQSPRREGGKENAGPNRDREKERRSRKDGYPSELATRSSRSGGCY